VSTAWATWTRIAIRNLARNRRRSAFTILAIAIGFGAVNVFGGFTEYIFRNLKDSFIYAQGNGHLTVFRKGFLTEGELDPLKFMLTDSEVERIRGFCQAEANVLLVTPQLHITGLLSNGRVSTIFIGIGRVPSDLISMQQQMAGMLGKLRLYRGQGLEDGIEHGVGLSFGLARKLKLDLDSDAIAMSPTVDGQINALDVRVFQLFKSPLEELDDKLMAVPLKFAQSLYNTTSVDRLTVLLREDALTYPMRAALQESLTGAGMEVDVMTWKELSPFYKKVKRMFDVIFLFLFVIVFVIVVMSVVNTVSMSIMERTREIGSLRALGLKRKGVMQLFAIESALLGAMGSFLGLLLSVAVWLAIRVFQPTWVPPNIPRRIPIELYLVPSYMLMSFACLMVLSVVSALLPARKAARKGIVDALGHI
jgi:putative ABC transport system permease protein